MKSKGSKAISNFTRKDRITVNEMTSKEFHFDINARIDVAAHPLRDRHLMEFFRELVTNNKHLFRNRVVLNIGCGLGLIAMFAASAGAKKVFAIDNSNIIDYTKRIIKENGYSNIVKVIKCRVQDLILNEELDVIISDWIGQALLFQCLCDDVMFARDKWLKKDTGVIIPDMATLSVAAVDCCHIRNDHVEWWGNVYGFNMSTLRDVVVSEPIQRNVPPSDVLSSWYVVKNLDLNTATRDSISFRSKLILKMLRPGTVGGFVAKFTVTFSKSHTPMTYHIDPYLKFSHWMHTIFFFDKPLAVNVDELLFGGLEMVPAEETIRKNRFSDLTINFELLRGDPSNMDIEVEMTFKLERFTIDDS